MEEFIFSPSMVLLFNIIIVLIIIHYGITLGKKQLNKGRVSLYLNYSYNGKRRKEYLVSFLMLLPVQKAKSGEQKTRY